MSQGFKDELDSIVNDALLYRRISPRHTRPDLLDSDGRRRLTGQSFQDWSDQEAKKAGLPGPCMSVGLAAILDKAGWEAAKMLEAHPEHGLAVLTAGAVRGLTSPDGTSWSQGIMANPTDKEPWHAVIFSKYTSKRTKGMQGALASLADWIIYLPGV